MTIQLESHHRAIVCAILRAVLPPGSTVWVFGSRATGKARPYSDLDLAIDATRPLTLHETATLADEFDESLLPWKVDVLDVYKTGTTFLKAIENDRKVLEDWQ